MSSARRQPVASPGGDPPSPRPRRAEWLTVLAAAATAGVALLAVVVAHVALAVPYPDLTMDPATRVGFPRYVGALSYLGVAAWFTGAACALFAASLLETRTDRARYLLALGLLTAWLGFDDLFLVHEGAGRILLGSERGEDIIFGLYAVIGAALLLLHRRVLPTTPVPVLVAAGAFFAASVGVDRPHLELPGQFLLEDGAKFVGIVLWATYLILTARRFLTTPGRAASERAGEQASASFAEAPARSR